MMKQRRDELKQKRGALQLNSDLEIDQDFVVSQAPNSVLPSSIRNKDEVGKFKSSHHQNIKKQEQEKKQKFAREQLEMKERHERAKNYSKNVRDLYIPGKVSKRESATDTEATANEQLEERKAYLGQDPDYYPQK